MSVNGVVFLEGFKTNLRPMDKSTDLESVMAWINDPKNRHFVLSYLPQTKRLEEDWFDKQGTDPKHIVLGIVAKPEMKLIGIMAIHRIDWKNRVGTTGTIIGNSKYWGRGYGTDAKMAFLAYVFLELGLHKINSEVLKFNPRSIAYSKKCGYRVEGRRREQVFREGKYHDVIELGVLRKDWEPIWRRWKKSGSVK